MVVLLTDVCCIRKILIECFFGGEGMEKTFFKDGFHVVLRVFLCFIIICTFLTFRFLLLVFLGTVAVVYYVCLVSVYSGFRL